MKKIIFIITTVLMTCLLQAQSLFFNTIKVEFEKTVYVRQQYKELEPDWYESIMKAGGFSIVQDPSSAEVDYMPQQAINRVKVNAIVEGDEIGGYLNKLLSR